MPRRAVALPLLLALATPGLAAAHGEAAAAGELVAEAAFLIDTLPPTGRELALALSSTGGGPEGATTAARLQAAFALSDRLGVTAGAGLASAPGSGLALDAPALSVKWLLRPAAAARTGFSASLDVLAAPGEPGGAELVAGLGALRQLGPFTARAALGMASVAGALAPHLHAGGSLAFAPAGPWRLLAEAIGEWSLDRQERSFAAGPTVKYALSDTSALAASLLVELVPVVRPLSVVVQLTRAL